MDSQSSIGGSARTPHVIPKSRHRSRYKTTSMLEAQTRRLEENHDDIMANDWFLLVLILRFESESFHTAEELFDSELGTLDKQFKDGK